MNYMSHFECDPAIVNGQWVIKGTRVTLKTVLASLAEGETSEAILEAFPALSAEDLARRSRLRILDCGNASYRSH
jgi:uncharacterized protein (DUF433 family)